MDVPVEVGGGPSGPGSPTPAATGGGARGVALMIAAAFAFSIMSAIVKRLSADGIPFFEVACARSLTGVVILLVWVRSRGVSIVVKNRRAMVLRTLSGTAAMCCTFYALAHMPLAEATALLNLTPLFIAFFGWVYLRERVSVPVLIALVAAFCGVLFVMRPDGTLAATGIVALVASVLSAVAMVTLRKLGATETPEAVVVHFSLWAGIITGVCSIPVFVVPSALDAALMLAAGVSATMGQLWMTRAYSLDRAARVGGGGYLTIVGSTAMGVLVFGEALPLSTAAGIAIIVGAGALLAFDAYRTANVSASRSPARSP